MPKIITATVVDENHLKLDEPLDLAPGTSIQITIPAAPETDVWSFTVQGQTLAETSETYQVVRVPLLGQPQTETPWEWFGCFQDDPDWAELFGEIERRRDAHLV